MAESNVQTLDEIVKAQGETTDNVSFVKTEDVIGNIDEPKFAYGDDGPMPGQPIELGIDYKKEKQEEKKTAAMQLIARAAKMKLQKERENFNKKSDEEKVRTYVVTQLLADQEKKFVDEYGYMMTGQQRRATRNRIETRYDKGKLHITKKQKEDILYQLNLASSDEAKQNPVKNSSGTAQTVGSLMTGI